MSEQERPGEEAAGDEVYQPQPDEEVTDDSGVLDPQDTLDDRGVDPALDEGYSPPEKPLGVGRERGGTREPDGGTLEHRLEAEEPDEEPDPRRADTATRSGRLIGSPSDDVTATDAGIAGGAASAEEAAMHLRDEDGEPRPPGDET